MNSDSDYYNKYLKYKMKFLNLKQIQNNLNNVKNTGSELNSFANKIKPFTGIIKKAFPFIKVGLSGAAEVVSLGIGGDEAIELAFVVLDSLLITIDLINLHNLNKIDQFRDLITDIINLRFTGFNNLITSYNNFMIKYSRLPQDIQLTFRTRICKVFDDLLLKLSTLFGDLLSMGLPDDSDVTSLLFQQYVKENINNNIDGILRHIMTEYKKLPSKFIELMENTVELENLIYNTFKIILALNTAKDMGFMAVIDPLTPLFTLILYKKKDIANTINYSFALFIFILKFLDDNCNK